MPLFSRTTAGVILALAIFTAPARAAQTGNGVVRGEVTDASGGVLPGVTVTATAADGRIIATTVTDGVGRYAFRKLPVGSLVLVFQLDGFDTARIELTVHAGREADVVERLRLAQFTENVVVYADAPVELAPPAPVVRWQPTRPTIVPVPVEEMESICLPARPGLAIAALGTIQPQRHDDGRMLYTKGDEVSIDGGTATGLEVGNNLVVRRHFRTGADDGTVVGEQTAGLVQIVAASERAAMAVVVHACSEMMEGDYLSWFIPEPLRTPEPAGIPAFEDAIRILFGDAGHLLGVTGRLMVIDRGSAEGIQPGQRLTLFRGETSSLLRPRVIGEAVVVSVRAYSATMRVEQATDAIWYGDWAALQLPSPLEPPVAKPRR